MHTFLYRWLWPALLLLLSLAALWATFIMPDTLVRPALVMAFLFICPGIALMRFLRLQEWYVELTLGVALSLALDGILATIFLYAHIWWPSVIIGILFAVSLVGACAQILLLRTPPTVVVVTESAPAGEV